MQIVLRKDVDTLGKAGSVVQVNPGYARNFLMPRKLAVSSESASAKQIAHELRIIKNRETKLRKEQGAYKNTLDGISLGFVMKASEEGRLFGSVTNMSIAERLLELGHEIDRRKITLPEPLKTLGEHVAHVQIAKGIVATLNITITKSEEEEPVVEEEDFKPESDDDDDERHDDDDD